jgi:hypothetical protein
MAQSRRRGQAARTEMERQRDGAHRSPPNAAAAPRQSIAARQETERLVEVGGEQTRRATEAAATAASATSGSASAMAGDAKQIAEAWANYAEEVMQHTSEASRALLRARTLSEMLEVQAKLLRDNMQSFIDQTSKFAEIAGRMAIVPFNALKQATGEQNRE